LTVFLLLVGLDYFSFPAFFIKVFFYIGMTVFGGLTGMQFSLAMTLQKHGGSSVASSAYAADLTGAAGGAVLASVFLIPVLGLPGTVLLLFGINLLVVLLQMRRS
jgi:predicted membrane-bound spermidine synthase